MRFVHVSEIINLTKRECYEFELFETEQEISQIELKIQRLKKSLDFYKSNKKELEKFLKKHKGE